jgi:hypothetical protein
MIDIDKVLFYFYAPHASNCCLEIIDQPRNPDSSRIRVYNFPLISVNSFLQNYEQTLSLSPHHVDKLQLNQLPWHW